MESFLSIVFTALLLSLSQGIAGQASDWVAPQSANALKNPVQRDQAAIAMGKTLFTAICFVCHGNEGKGDGINAANLERKPADLTSRLVQRQSDGALFWKISEGNPPMLTFKESLTEEQRWQLVHFLRELPKLYPPEPKVEETIAATKTTTADKKSMAEVSSDKSPTTPKVKPEDALSTETSTADLPNPFAGISDGKMLFRNICGACHTIGKGKLIGPDLKGAHEKHPREWLYKWIRSSQSMVKAGDPVAVKLFEENNKLIMTDQPNLSIDQIDAILNYIALESQPKEPAKVSSAPTTAPRPPVRKPPASLKTRMGWADYFAMSVMILVFGSLLYVLFLLSGLTNKPGKDENFSA